MPFIRNRIRDLLPVILCVISALATAIAVTARANEPGSGAADETGMGNSYEYPNGTLNASPGPRSQSTNEHGKQEAGTLAPRSKPTPAANTSADQFKEKSTKNSVGNPPTNPDELLQ